MDVKQGMIVRLASKEVLDAWSGIGSVPTDHYGGRAVYVNYCGDNRFHIQPSETKGKRQGGWVFLNSFAVEEIKDETIRKEVLRECGWKEKTCPVCGKLFITHINARVLCDDCHYRYGKCSVCGQYHKNDELTRIGDEKFCQPCLANKIAEGKIKKCPTCGEYTTTVYECGMCDNCLRGVESYHTMKGEGECEFHKMPRERHPLYLGAEIEVENNEDMDDDDLDEDAIEVKKIFGTFIHHEEDGSLDNGFENITQPATLAYHNSVRDKYIAAFSYLSHRGYTSHNNGDCGLHVHFNRNFYGADAEEECLAKLLWMVDKFWNELVIFSRRSESQLNRWARKYTDDPATVAKHKDDGRYGRYFSVNLTNRKTIEFRMFRGTLNVESYFATLALVDRLVRLSASCTVEEIKALTWDVIIGDGEIKAYYDRVKNRRVISSES